MEEISLVRLAAKIQADEETFALFTASKSFDSGFFAKFKEKNPACGGGDDQNVSSGRTIPMAVAGLGTWPGRE